MARGPGEVYRRLFGAPDADDGSVASRGEVVFHDALWVPDEGEGARLPLARDILTPHHTAYYTGKDRPLPNDYEDPIPVAFLTVKRETRFVAALTGSDDELVEAARCCLLDALDLWGIGGKTAAGYGRVEEVGGKGSRKARAARRRAPGLGALEAEIRQAVAGKPGLQVLEAIEGQWIGKLEELAAQAPEDARRIVRDLVPANKRTKERLSQLLARLGGREK